MEPFIRTPARLAPPMPAKKLSGMLMTSAQGQLMTSSVSAQYSQSPQSGLPPPMSCTSGGTIASRSAEMHTAGV